jgi:hypothetical protein
MFTDKESTDLYATSRKKITIQLIPDPANPFFLRVYRLSTPEEGEIVPKKSVHSYGKRYGSTLFPLCPLLVK